MGQDHLNDVHRADTFLTSIRIPQLIHHEGMNAIFSLNTRALFPPSSHALADQSHDLPGWDGVLLVIHLVRLQAEAAAPLSSLSPSPSPSLHQTRPSSLCAAPLLSETTNHAVPSFNGNIYLGEMVVPKSISTFCNVFCSRVIILRFSLPSWPVTKKKERMSGGRECMWTGCERHLPAYCKKRCPPVEQTLSSTFLLKEATVLTSKLAKLLMALKLTHPFPLKWQPP